MLLKPIVDYLIFMGIVCGVTLSVDDSLSVFMYVLLIFNEYHECVNIIVYKLFRTATAN